MTATFVPAPRLVIERSGEGNGTVLSSPSGIVCGERCSAAFTPGQEVVLEAVADRGSAFGGWSGACSGNQETCEVVLDDDALAMAAFDVAPVEHVRTITLRARNGAVVGAAFTPADSMHAPAARRSRWSGNGSGCHGGLSRRPSQTMEVSTPSAPSRDAARTVPSRRARRPAATDQMTCACRRSPAASGCDLDSAGAEGGANRLHTRGGETKGEPTRGPGCESWSARIGPHNRSLEVIPPFHQERSREAVQCEDLRLDFLQTTGAGGLQHASYLKGPQMAWRPATPSS